MSCIYLISFLLAVKVYVHGTTSPFPRFRAPVISQLGISPCPIKCQNTQEISLGICMSDNDVILYRHCRFVLRISLILCETKPFSDEERPRCLQT